MDAVAQTMAPLEAMNARAQDGWHPTYGYVGQVQRAIDDDKTFAILFNKYAGLKHSEYREALLEALVLVKIKRNEAVAALTQRGQLLLCWHGSKVLRATA